MIIWFSLSFNSLLGHESKGSILSVLKSRSWATGLDAGLSSVKECDFSSAKLLLSGFLFRQSHFTIFYLVVWLTPSGLKHLDKICSIIFQYIRIVRSAKSSTLKSIYSEQKFIKKMEFKFKKKQDATSLSRNIAQKLHQYPFEHVLSANRLFEEFNYEVVSRDELIFLLSVV